MIWKSHQGFYRYFMKYAETFGKKFLIQIIGLLLILTAVFRSLIYVIGEPFIKKFRNNKQFFNF